jgi:hypothetical protein
VEIKLMTVIRCALLTRFTIALIAMCCAAWAYAQPVKDLRYGVTLYNFYQDNYFDAITELMIAEQRGGIQKHGAEPLLLRGGISLSYGMRHTAEALFKQHLKASDNATRDLAWFYSGKLAYLDADYNHALHAWNRIGEALSPNQQNERWVLAGISQLKLNQPAAALQALERVEDDSPWRFYADYNRGIAQLAKQASAKAVKAFIDVTEHEAEQREYRALQQSALLAAGYTELQANRSKQAATLFQQMALEGPSSNAALLGYGWAAARSKDFKRALAPWQILSKQPVYDSNAQEGLLAVAYAYEQLNAKGAATDAYEHAASTLQNLSLQLDQTATTLTDTAWLAPLVMESGSPTLGAFWALEHLPAHDENARILSNTISSSEFHQALRHYRDLLALRGVVHHWQSSMDSFRTMIATRTEAFARTSATATPTQRQARIQSLTQRHQTLATRIDQALQNHDYLPLLEGDTRKQWQRLAHMRNAVTKIGGAQHTRWARLHGILLWNIEDNLAARVWELRKRLHVIDQAVTEATRNHQAVAQVQQNPQRSMNTSQQDINAKEQHLRQLANRLDQRIATQEKLLSDLATHALDQQKARLQRYIAYARLALTRLYDAPIKGSSP